MSELTEQVTNKEVDQLLDEAREALSKYTKTTSKPLVKLNEINNKNKE